MEQDLMLRPLQSSDYVMLIELWRAAGWIDVRPSDTPQALENILARNPGCSFGAFDGSQLVGALLAGHDGWRGYLYHMAVEKKARGRGIGRQLVMAVVEALRREGVPRVHCLVKQENDGARKFWQSCGFVLRDELVDYSLS